MSLTETSLIEWTSLLFLGATAAATGITAFVLWHQWRGAIQVEWEPSWEDLYENSIPPTLRCRITVRNYRNFAISARFVETQGCPVTNVITKDREKHKSWAPNKVPVHLDVSPGASNICGVSIFLDWATLVERKWVKFRPNSSSSLRIQINLASKSNRRMRIKRKTTVPIPNAMIVRVAKIGQK